MAYLHRHNSQQQHLDNRKHIKFWETECWQRRSVGYNQSTSLLSKQRSGHLEVTRYDQILSIKQTANSSWCVVDWEIYISLNFGDYLLWKNWNDYCVTLHIICSLEYSQHVGLACMTVLCKRKANIKAKCLESGDINIAGDIIYLEKYIYLEMCMW